MKGKRVGLFSYGSGLAATMFSFKAGEGSGDFTLDRMVQSISDLKSRLESRVKISPDNFAKIMKLREDTHQAGKKLKYFMHINCIYLKKVKEYV